MNEIRLRTMTLKSALHSGKYEGCTVSQVMGVDLPYLIWLYYHNERVTYCDEVLAQLHITDDIRIEKPGIGPPYLLHNWWQYICKHLPHEEYIKIRAMSKKGKKVRSNKIIKSTENIRKGVDQSYNLKRMTK